MRHSCARRYHTDTHSSPSMVIEERRNLRTFVGIAYVHLNKNKNRRRNKSVPGKYIPWYLEVYIFQHSLPYQQGWKTVKTVSISSAVCGTSGIIVAVALSIDSAERWAINSAGNVPTLRYFFTAGVSCPRSLVVDAEAAKSASYGCYPPPPWFVEPLLGPTTVQQRPPSPPPPHNTK